MKTMYPAQLQTSNLLLPYYNVKLKGNILQQNVISCAYEGKDSKCNVFGVTLKKKKKRVKCCGAGAKRLIERKYGLPSCNLITYWVQNVPIDMSESSGCTKITSFCSKLFLHVTRKISH